MIDTGENMDEKKIVIIDYTNWRDVTALRRIIPIEVFFGATEWHRQEQWFLRAYDVDKDVERSFAIKDIKSWQVEHELNTNNTNN